MQMHCQDCGWVGCCTELLSGEDDGHGPRGVCPNCGADEEEFAEANEREIETWQASQQPAEHRIN
ncbi:hypothetical protein [Pseudomonas aeruginosa]|uniref:hypothetical protein n=1 Tax=Pseudomonas aeruginosa TaxID=287 RepID=UPI000B07AF3B|nr:hypothetical protein [Pseudomonas aeruginosa]TQH90957.1 hypothetical protein FLI92_24580 [Pseudomonas aeruginosa]TQI14640.1 hypothetical protein FLI93_19415 [Pseudomonas aeruginosa]UTQ87196.1 hypothetical protein MMZ68_33435 [Pseudomonas aeruginosa]HBO7489486.1 hypothetical protein [Pseudomonas aeruginosa]